MAGRIWIYNAQRPLTFSELEEISVKIKDFLQNWKAHGKDLDASFEWIENQILILKVNEDKHFATGCSIDTWMAFLTSINQYYNLDLFKRDRLAIEQNGKILFIDMSNIAEEFQKNNINENSFLLDHTISKLTDFDNYKKPITQSWLARKLPLNSN